ncbi:MAG: hypothetical protein NC420_03390 [Eubacterium sp.]|nr:hypothetical protein [Eubacterium sp.]MCM1304337.1 hypothetical protein [Butyrivibrio sp.]MCM1344319.1 hypothetical protein [Muribaculaceae bacterium]MCM1410079.1 hypothetical protein [Lachnospiraceae bacterium]
MAFGSIDLTTISRAQDFSGIKQNEDNKGMFAQTFISQDVQKNTEQRIREVHRSDDPEWHQKNPDAKEKGNGTYYGDGGRRRKGAKPQERVVIKGREGFDMKI